MPRPSMAGNAATQGLGSVAQHLGRSGAAKEGLIYFMAAQGRPYRDIPNVDLNAAIALYRVTFTMERAAGPRGEDRLGGGAAPHERFGCGDLPL